MNRKLFTTCLTASFCGLIASTSGHTEPVRSAAPAQRLVDDIIGRHPELLDVLLHVTPPDRLKNTVIAAHLPQDVGEVSGDDDLGVASTGKPLVEVQKDGIRIGVLLQLRDARHHAIGAIGLMFPWHAGDRQAVFLARAKRIRDEIAARIVSRQSLFLAG